MITTKAADAQQTGIIITELFSGIHEGYITIWGKDERQKLTRWIDLSLDDALTEAATSARIGSAKGFDMYVSTGTSRTRSDSAHRINKMQGMCWAAPALFIDVDTHQDGAKDDKRVPQDIDTAMHDLDALPYPPTMVVCSGHGLHAYWQLDTPIIMDGVQDAAKTTELMIRFAQGVCALCGDDWANIDTHVSEPARVLRIDGTANYKH